MRPHFLSAVAIVLLLATAHLLSVGVFLKGFLLTRLELPNVSGCRDPELSRSSQPEPTLHQKNTSVSGGCWTDKSFDRAAVVIVDALRYDFVFGNAGAPRGAAMPKLLGLLADAVRGRVGGGMAHGAGGVGGRRRKGGGEARHGAVVALRCCRPSCPNR